jgi:hypothetical protein
MLPGFPSKIGNDGYELIQPVSPLNGVLVEHHEVPVLVSGFCSPRLAQLQLALRIGIAPVIPLGFDQQSLAVGKKGDGFIFFDDVPEAHSYSATKTPLASLLLTRQRACSSFRPCPHRLPL